MKVLAEAGYLALKVSRQVFYNAETDSLAALHGDDIITEAEPWDLDKLDTVLRAKVNVKVLGLNGPGAESMGRYLKRYISYVPGAGYEWN